MNNSKGDYACMTFTDYEMYVRCPHATRTWGG